jgi:hypothetical protein
VVINKYQKVFVLLIEKEQAKNPCAETGSLKGTKKIEKRKNDARKRSR